MPFGTMRFLRVKCANSNAGHDVFDHRKRLQMLRINASPITAFVIWKLTFRQRSGEMEISKLMGFAAFPSAKIKAAIPMLVDTGNPVPAAGNRVDLELGHEPVDLRNCGASSHRSFSF